MHSEPQKSVSLVRNTSQKIEQFSAAIFMFDQRNTFRDSALGSHLPRVVVHKVTLVGCNRIYLLATRPYSVVTEYTTEYIY